MKYPKNVLTLLLLAAIWNPGDSWTTGTTACGRRLSAFVREQSATPLYGILDEMNADNNGSTAAASGAGSSNDATASDYEKWFQELIFCTGDSLQFITKRLDDFADPGFLKWLKDSQAKCEDTEEFLAIKDLRTSIDDAMKAKEDAETIQKALDAQKQQQEAERQQRLLDEAAAQQKESNVSSSADILKKANEIDQAVVNAEASEDNQPDDFMRDAKAVCGLGGFNNKGQMRVGGN
eukprot:CAMPEP_0194227022 /NCGR_PEP_ID=MMETSP0156-20130528/42646_1 /TAXON_ID=33649 /ORGANISM="Thalassionema nitzschioides, Strain L26-B" /LENGTH=235 /DNA_ID=CAMNT_0038959495 /DNA_START=1 /DNA_END=708 /DNA_ORIENTATION=+